MGRKEVADLSKEETAEKAKEILARIRAQNPVASVIAGFFEYKANMETVTNTGDGLRAQVNKTYLGEGCYMVVSITPNGAVTFGMAPEGNLIGANSGFSVTVSDKVVYRAEMSVDFMSGSGLIMLQSAAELARNLSAAAYNKGKSVGGNYFMDLTPVQKVLTNPSGIPNPI